MKDTLISVKSFSDLINEKEMVIVHCIRSGTDYKGYPLPPVIKLNTKTYFMLNDVLEFNLMLKTEVE